jgi:signal transduction histidine kinase
MVQALVVAIFLIHEAGDGRLGFPPINGVDRIVPFVAFFIPILYAALVFGFWGSVATTVLSTVLALVDTFLDAAHYSTYELASILVQVLLFGVVAILVGERIEAEQTARAAARAAAHGVVRGQEDERRRVAQELHDQPVQTLIILCRGLDAVSANAMLPEGTRKQVAAARQTAEETIEGLRRIARGLRPPALDDLGLQACIGQLVTDIEERTDILAELRLPERPTRLTPEVELAIFRIAQEALSNVERHARAHNVSVALAVERNAIALFVDDDGVGFEHPAAASGPSSTSLGLIGMTERAQLLGGNLEIVSTPGGGTQLRAVVPFPPDDDPVGRSGGEPA